MKAERNVEGAKQNIRNIVTMYSKFLCSKKVTKQKTDNGKERCKQMGRIRSNRNIDHHHHHP
jgi:hypothetical protein